MSNITAFLIFKDMKPSIDRLTNEETGQLFKALFEYAVSKTLPDESTLSKSVSLLFPIFQKALDKNEERYEKKCEANRKYQEKRKAKQKKSKTGSETAQNGSKTAKGVKAEKIPDKKNKSDETTKNQPQHKALTREQGCFLKSFTEHCPRKALDCQIADMPKVDYNKLMFEIKKSPFLMKNDALALKWCLEHSEDIINGKYRTFEDETPKPGIKPQIEEKKEYTKEELTTLFDSLDSV